MQFTGGGVRALWIPGSVRVWLRPADPTGEIVPKSSIVWIRQMGRFRPERPEKTLVPKRGVVGNAISSCGWVGSKKYLLEGAYSVSSISWIHSPQKVAPQLRCRIGCLAVDSLLWARRNFVLLQPTEGGASFYPEGAIGRPSRQNGSPEVPPLAAATRGRPSPRPPERGWTRRTEALVGNAVC